MILTKFNMKNRNSSLKTIDINTFGNPSCTRGWFIKADKPKLLAFWFFSGPHNIHQKYDGPAKECPSLSISFQKKIHLQCTVHNFKTN